MTPSPATSSAQIAREMADALRAGDLVRAQQLIDDLGQGADPRILASVAGLYVRQSRWSEAVAVFDRIHDADLSCQLQRQMAANLAVLQQARPDVYHIVTQTTPQTQCEVSQLGSGQLTLSQTLPGRGRVSPSRGTNPRQDAQQLLASMGQVIGSRHALLLAGIGDGYLLHALASEFVRIGGDFLPTVYVIEPDPEVMVNCMMIHDYTGPLGPLACANFCWYLGPAWEQHLRHTVLEDLFMPDPLAFVCLSLRGQGLKDRANQIFQLRRAPERELANGVAAYYDTLTTQTLVELLGPHPPRQPRVLVTTCRFTTVLQYSSQDVVNAFEELGWQTKLLIEPSPAHRLTYVGLRQTLLDFKPDMVFCIDHLRCQTGDLYPANLPYLCWIQDHLPHLTRPEAGASIQSRDFVLTLVGPMYTEVWGYPPRQIVEIPKLTRPLARPPQATSAGDDLVYVSTASKTPEALADELGKDPFLASCGREMLAIYQCGQSLPTLWHVGQVVDRVAKQLNKKLAPTDRSLIVMKLFHPLNNALYRQQVLRWVAAVADELGLSLALYGPGWDQHPDFARFARGPIAYGPDLEQLTRDTKINLQIVPSICLHQRMLDGLAAGGFFLVRQHPSDTLMPRFLAMLDPHSQTVDQAMAAAGDHRGQLEAMFAQAQCLTDLGHPIDLIAWLRACQRGGLMTDDGHLLPRLDEVSFHDAPTLRCGIERFLNNEALRRQVSEQQRISVENRLSYTAGVRRVLSRIRQLLAEPAAVKRVA